MKNKLRNVLLYIVKNYPYVEDLTITRMTKLVYLIDREYTKKYGKQITEISWYFDRYGPYVSDVFAEINEDENISSELPRLKEVGASCFIHYCFNNT